jgi:hypothetical protein
MENTTRIVLLDTPIERLCMEDSSIVSPMALCELCWMEEHSKWEPQSVNEDGNILVKLVGVDMPTIINTGSVDVCCMCGSVTIAGIYELKKQEEIYFTNDEFSKDFEFNFYSTEDE